VDEYTPTVKYDDLIKNKKDNYVMEKLKTYEINKGFTIKST